jgi:formylglycine-generating enzyme required for sulfatase activity
MCTAVWLALLSSVGAQPTNPPTAGARLKENSLGMKFAPLPGTGVLLAIWETRVQDYAVFAQATGRPWTKPDFEQGPGEPVVNVTWEDAVAFCAWLTTQERKTGKLGPRQRYRLPKDEEWSLGVSLAPEMGKTPEQRMKTLIVWPWGSNWPPPAGAGNYGPELRVDRFANTSPVGSFAPNRLGFYDLGGNVWEWCEDWFNPASVTKVLRGGSFHDDQPKDLLAAYRFSATMHLSNDDIGFRIALDPGE